MATATTDPVAAPRTRSNDELLRLYRLDLGPADDGSPTHYSILNVPSCSPKSSSSSSNDFYNILMADVSGSMNIVWGAVMNQWNDKVAPVLTGKTDIYTFGSKVTFRRHEPHLELSDFDATLTNLTEALSTINDSVENTDCTNIRVFLITDGQHNSGDYVPEVEIENMDIPSGKIIEVYLLGVGLSFPVQYSVDIRSHLHNGSASCPTIFWSKECNTEHITDQMSHIQEEIIKSTNKVKLSIPGKTVPLTQDSKCEAHAGEYLLYENDPETLKSQLKVTSEDGDVIPFADSILVATPDFLVFKLYKQWNSVLIQMHRNKQDVPMAVFDMMQKAFDLQMTLYPNVASGDLHTRIQNKNIKTWQMEFKALMNQSRNIIQVQSKYADELELAEAIFKSTVQSRYDTKLMKIKGHGDADWQKDTEEFEKIYQSIAGQIRALADPEPDECCRILMCSFLGDLKDPNFVDVLQENKMSFLTTMTFTGVPIYAPVKDSAQINPWTLHIKNICVSPFEILSQRSMESSLAVSGTDATSPDKEITLQQDNPNSVFNAIVPIIPKEHCQLLKKLVRTNVFTVGATFCILKSALIADHNCHFAALGCVWMRTITEYPRTNRPEFIEQRIANVEETAKLYLDRKGFANYISALLTKPDLALMTEAPDEYNGSILRCESMIKPAFMLHLAKDKIQSQGSKTTTLELLKMILVEFLGRCLTSNQSNTPYMDFLVADFSTEQRAQWLKKITDMVLARLKLTGDVLLEACFCPDDVPQHTGVAVTEAVATLLGEDSSLDLQASPNMHALVRLRNSGSAGQVGWEDLRAWAQEMVGPAEAAGGAALLTQEDVDGAFSSDAIVSYLHHALQHRPSRERFVNSVAAPADALQAVLEKLKHERNQYLKAKLLPEVEKAAVQKWCESYDRVHRELAVPLTRAQIIQEATARDIDVTEQTFDKIYKYREGVQLCRNCCHVRSCPHFLKANRRFNCHLEVERRNQFYPHCLHLVVSRTRHDPTRAYGLIREGTETGTNNRPARTLQSDDKNKDEDDLKKYVADLDAQYDNVDV